MDYSNLAYAKINLSYDKNKFIHEYDNYILPLAKETACSRATMEGTRLLNLAWKMVPDELYDKSDYHIQEGDDDSFKFFKGQFPQWRLQQLMRLSETSSDPLVEKYAKKGGGVAFRNASLNYNFEIKPQYRNLQIVKWIVDNLPFEKINHIQCISIEPTGFITIHRDARSLYSKENAILENKVFKSGFIVVNINISNGGSPLFWALDGKDVFTPLTCDDDIYLTNDYFFHGVGICSSRRRQIRITGIPGPAFFSLFDKDTIIEIDNDYVYDNEGYPE